MSGADIKPVRQSIASTVGPLRNPLRQLSMRKSTSPDPSEGWALQYGVISLVVTFLAILLSPHGLAQEAPAPENLSPRQTKQLALIRDAIQKATNIVESSDGLWTVPLWAEIAGARARAGDIPGAVNVLRRFSGDDQHLKDIAKATAPYLISRGAAQQALGALESSTNGDAKFIGFRAIISAQVQTGETAGAADTLGQMSRAAARDMQMGQPGARGELSADSQREIESAMRTVAVALAQSGNLAHAMDIASVIKDGALRTGALLPIGVAQLQAGDRTSAENTFMYVQEAIQGIPDKSAQAYAILQLAKARAQGKDSEDAFRAVGMLHKPDAHFSSFYENALGEIALEQARWGDAPGASNTIERIESLDGKLMTLEDIASLRLKTGDQSGALLACQQGIRLIPFKIESREIVSRVANLALIQASAGDLSAADKSLAQALAMATAIKEAAARFPAMADVAVAQAQIGNTEAALRVQGNIAVEYWEQKNRVARSMAQSEAASNHPFEAFGTMISAECPQGNQRRVCLEEYDVEMAAVTRVLTSNGNEKLALAWVERSNSAEARALAFLEMAKGFLDQISAPISIATQNKMGWNSY